MFNGAEQSFILLWCPYLCQRGFKLFVCTLCLCVSTYVLHQSDFQGSESEPEMLFLSLFAYLSFQQLLFLVSIACSCVFSPHSSPKNIASALILLPAISYSAPLISATSLLHTLCSLSAVFLDMWWTEAVCASNLASPLSFLFSPPLSPALSVIPEFRFGCSWQFGPLWDPGYGRSKINLHFFP